MNRGRWFAFKATMLVLLVVFNFGFNQLTKQYRGGSGLVVELLMSIVQALVALSLAFWLTEKIFEDRDKR